MIYLIIPLSALLWRIRGGLWKEYIPGNKIWYAVGFGLYGYFYFLSIQSALVGFAACYTSYQLYGWGLYLGRLLSGGELKPNLNQYRECELIDDLLYSAHITFKGKTIYLWEYPRAFGFCGTTLTGLIITFLWGLYLQSFLVIFSGLAMGVIYWLGGKFEKILVLGKNGWNWGEWLFGAYLGLIGVLQCQLGL